ncbi:hypothetical protein BZA70DRAFT_283740 [Myxozyma melibiosi]|uniref:TMEM205-like domain-containing protein n=1 Tax=Myxozyma melibiosi TaxID=54550 RepID=A0ABR1EZL6_9ASCO
MSSALSTLATGAPYHVFAYSILFGSTVYQSFFVGITAFRALPRQHFAALQRKIFPPYFAMQAIIPAFLALTAPFPILDDKKSLTILAFTAVTALVNLISVGPQTVKLMNERKAQETKEGKKYYDAEVSDEMKALNKKFGMIHGISTLVNLGTLFAIGAYGVTLSAAMAKGFVVATIAE